MEEEMKNYQITQWCANFIRQQVQEGDLCIDATMGNGNDTLLLSQLCGTSGKVYAFDIQKQALEATQAKLTAENAPENLSVPAVSVVLSLILVIFRAVTTPLQQKQKPVFRL